MKKLKLYEREAVDRLNAYVIGILNVIIERDEEPMKWFIWAIDMEERAKRHKSYMTRDIFEEISTLTFILFIDNE